MAWRFIAYVVLFFESVRVAGRPNVASHVSPGLYTPLGACKAAVDTSMIQL